MAEWAMFIVLPVAVAVALETRRRKKAELGR
jgi:hypothetical protein